MTFLEAYIISMMEEGYEVSFRNHPVNDEYFQIELRKDNRWLKFGIPKAVLDIEPLATELQFAKQQFEEEDET